MWKECNIHLLPSSEKSNILRGYSNKSLLFNYQNEYKIIDSEKDSTSYFHLYITDGSDIKENTNTFKESINGDWFLNTIYKTIQRTGDITPYDFKIIVTTDTLRVVTKDKFGGKDNQHLPQIPKQFIEYYISEYNAGKKIEKVLVEFEAMNTTIIGRMYNDFEPKLSPTNEIKIKPIEQKMYSREDVEKLLWEVRKFYNDYKDIPYNRCREPFKTWIKENLK